MMDGDFAPEHFTEDAWNYPACPDPTSNHDLGVVDGDTFDLWLYLSPHSIEPTRIRFMHISTGEIRFVRHDSDEYKRGIKHYNFVLNWFKDAIERADGDGADWPLLAETSWQLDLRGQRFLADVYDYAGRSLAEDLLDEFGEEVRTPEKWHPNA